MRIVDEELGAKVRAEVAGRCHVGARPTNRSKHLFPSSSVAVPATRATRYSERTMIDADATASVAPAKIASLSIALAADVTVAALLPGLLTPDLMMLSSDQFRREVKRVAKTRDANHTDMRQGLANRKPKPPTWPGTHSRAQSAIARRHDRGRDAERSRRVSRLSVRPPVAPTVVLHFYLVQLYKRKLALCVTRSRTSWFARTGSRALAG